MERPVNTKISADSFLRIPGISDEGTRTTLVLDGTVANLEGCIELLNSTDPGTRHRAIRVLEDVSSPSRSEMHVICSALLRVMNRKDQDSILAESALIHFLGLHQKSLEPLNIGAQLLRLWGADASASPARQAFSVLLNEEISQLRFTSNPINRPEIVAKRYILFRAFEVPVLRASAACAIQAIMEDSVVALQVERKAFAGQFLALLRSLPGCESDYDPLRRLATSVFATGMATRMSLVSPQAKYISHSAPSLATPTTTHDISSAHAPEARALMDRLLADTGGQVLARLGPQDYEVLRKIKGLSLDDFRGITEKIRFKAASDPWARAAILDLVRSPHDSGVSHGVRTAVLGALVNDARKIGKLSSQLEKEVFAISAEIPALQLSIQEKKSSCELSGDT